MGPEVTVLLCRIIFEGLLVAAAVNYITGREHHPALHAQCYPAALSAWVLLFPCLHLILD